MTIEDLLADAADDTGRPLNHSVDDIVRRGRRATLVNRTAAVTTTVLTTAAVITGVMSWTANRPDDVQPAGPPGQHLTVDPATGKVVEPPQPISPLSDEQIIARCRPLDERWASKNGLSGSIDGWKVQLKEGSGSRFEALLRSPDGKEVALCAPDRRELGEQPVYSRGRWAYHQVPPAVRRFVVETADGRIREIRVKDSFYLKPPAFYHDENRGTGKTSHFRGYDEQGQKVLDWRSELPDHLVR